MADERKSPGKVEAKAKRDQRLAAALRANIKRRKAAGTAETEPGDDPAAGRRDAPKGEGKSG